MSRKKVFILYFGCLDPFGDQALDTCIMHRNIEQKTINRSNKKPAFYISGCSCFPMLPTNMSILARDSKRLDKETTLILSPLNHSYIQV